MERKKFQVHPGVIKTLINSQAGTLSKAILESVMNSVDAGATRIDIDMDQGEYSVRDDGKGFQGDDEIEHFFGTLGTPHEEGDATFGFYRLGRGQGFSFGKQTWRSATYKMVVDMKSDDEAFMLSSDEDHIPGCAIHSEFFEPLMPSALASTIRDVSEQIRYVNVPVYINSKRVSVDPSRQKWDHETDAAYIKTTEGSSLKVYNQGVFVREYPSYNFGTGGVVVSKVNLRVNMARNDVLISKCEVWKRLSKYLKSSSTKRASRKTRLTNHEREHLLRSLMDGTVDPMDVVDKAIVWNGVGRACKLGTLIEDYNETRLTVAPDGEKRRAESVMQTKAIKVLGERTLDCVGLNLERFVERLRETVGTGGVPPEEMDQTDEYRFHRYRWDRRLSRVKIVDFDKVAPEDSKLVLVKDKDLSVRELCALRALRKGNHKYTTMVEGLGHNSERRIVAGESDGALGWTDGMSFVAINRSVLREMKDGFIGAQHLVSIVLHEYCHNEANICEDVHDEQFYERYHNAVIENPRDYSNAVVLTVNMYMQYLENNGIEMNKELLVAADRVTQSDLIALEAENDAVAPPTDETDPQPRMQAESERSEESRDLEADTESIVNTAPPTPTQAPLDLRI